MPPRHAYWTILIDDTPTAFRAREREELQPTLVQLQRKNANVTMQWFARGKLWPSREAEHEDFQRQKLAASAPRERSARPERRGSDWRPGGSHKDPRDRFKKKNRPERAWSEKDPATQRERDKPGWAAKPPNAAGRDTRSGPPKGDRPPRERRPWQDKPGFDPRRNPPDRTTAGGYKDRPWQTKPTGPRAQRKPWVGKPGPSAQGAPFKPRGDRPWSAKPPGQAPRGDRPWSTKPPSGEQRPWKPKPPSGEQRPWTPKPPAGDQRPWRPKPPAGEQRPWKPKPAGGGARGDKPWRNAPPSGDKRPWSGKPRSDKPGGFSAGAPRGDQKPWQKKKPFRPSGPPRPDARGRGDARKRRDDEPPDRD